MKETDQARQSFEDYWGLGPSRSLPKLAKQYRASTKAVPTKHLSRLKIWSTEHNWQARLIERIEEEADEVRRQLRERAVAFRERIATALEVDLTRYLNRLKAQGGEMMADDAASVERLTKLFFQLAEVPLAERTEHTGKEGGPIEVDHGGSALEEINSRLSGLVARIGEAGTSPDAD